MFVLVMTYDIDCNLNFNDFKLLIIVSIFSYGEKIEVVILKVFITLYFYPSQLGKVLSAPYRLRLMISCLNPDILFLSSIIYFS